MSWCLTFNHGFLRCVGFFTAHFFVNEVVRDICGLCHRLWRVISMAILRFKTSRFYVVFCFYVFC